MNLSDPKFRVQVRKVTLIFSGIAMVTSAAGIAMSLYALNVALKREHLDEVLTHFWRYPEEMKTVDCLMEGEVKPERKIFCDYFGGEVRPPR